MAIPQMPGGGIANKSMTLKDQPGVIYSINDQSKTYSETKISDAANEDRRTYEVKKLGEETINGYKCVHALVTEDTETHEILNTKDIGDFAKYSQVFKSNKRLSSEKREQAFINAGCEGFPVKTMHKGNPREGDMTMELVKLEKKPFKKTDFEIPASYSKSATASPGTAKTQQEIMNMTPEERAKYIEELKKSTVNKH